MTGIILAGGKSSRMGTNKALLKINGKTIVEILISKMQELFTETIIVTNSIEEYKFIVECGRYKKVRIIRDIVPDMGSLSGLHSGLVDSKSKYNFIVACDMPFINQDVILYMLEESKGYDVVIAERNSRLQPFCAVYSKNCIKPIKDEVLKNNLRVRDFFKYVKVKVITEKEAARYDLDGLSFVNINTPEDHNRFKDMKNNLAKKDVIQQSL